MGCIISAYYFAEWLIQCHLSARTSTNRESITTGEGGREGGREEGVRGVRGGATTYEIGEKGSAGAHLELGELLRFVAGVLGVEELGEEELAQLGALAEDGRVGQRGPEEVDAVPGCYVDAVADVGRARIDGLDDDERVQEVRCDHVGCERCVLLLEHHRHDVVTDVTLPLQLLRIVLRVRKQRRHVEHDFPVTERVVNRLDSRLSELCVQSSSITIKSDSKRREK